MTTFEDKYIGKRLRRRRLQVGMSQRKLAKFEGLTFQQIQKEEKGANRIPSGRLYRFAEILCVPTDYFFDGLEEERRLYNMYHNIEEPDYSEKEAYYMKNLDGRIHTR